MPGSYLMKVRKMAQMTTVTTTVKYGNGYIRQCNEKNRKQSEA